MKKYEKSIKAWHFTGDELRDGRPIPPIGTKLVHDGEILKCRFGYHASLDPFAALMYAPGTALHYVQCGGEVIHGDDKLVCRERTILASRDMAKELRLFACHCVRHTPLGDGRTVWDLLTDERSRNAVEVAERFAHGKATVKELATTRDAACDADRAAASSAASSVVRAATRAARAAVCAAADASARAAAWNAADAAARDVTWAVARKWQRKEFNKVVATAFNAEPQST